MKLYQIPSLNEFQLVPRPDPKRPEPAPLHNRTCTSTRNRFEPNSYHHRSLCRMKTTQRPHAFANRNCTTIRRISKQELHHTGAPAEHGNGTPGRTCPAPTHEAAHIFTTLKEKARGLFRKPRLELLFMPLLPLLLQTHNLLPHPQGS